ncbi:MAG: TonB-dependent receptor [Ignavibacteriota bacterium]|nr:TonB-dependent receptor [Ignavibacterium sp.]MCO6449112.1 TonB-dependent receptor [Ignavibacterium album]MCZ2269399.1 TonB-dependent receptor [Ignavibacteriales bacterium]MDX9711799.1 TonB-dependent receptor [Ignavibacteriaceae bacterium]QKJ99531.1 MAG: TonB-dependent receptor [Ignavibacteriota bacterium]
MSFNSQAQAPGRLRGVVTDSTNGEVLAFCNIVIEDLKIGAATDKRGMFVLNKLPANTEMTVMVSYIGYKTKKISFLLKPDELLDLKIQMTPLNIELNAVEKIGERYVDKNVTDLGLEIISMRQLEVIPKGVETDVMRSLQYLSGVSSTGDISARYYVRGGSSDQNLVLLNGITLYAPFHSLGLFSSIEPDMINSIEFFKGGFTSEYSGRLSSILNVITKDGNKNAFNASASASFLTGKGMIQGPIPNGSFMLSGRFSYSDKILKSFLDQKTVPVNFYDIAAKINYSSPDIFNNAKFSLFAFITDDKIKYSDPLRESYLWKNNLLGFEWLQVYDAPVFSRLGISLSKFEGKIIPNGSNLKPLVNNLQDISISFDLNAVFDSKDQIDIGLLIKLMDSELRLENKSGIESDISRFTGNISAYAKYKLLRFENFGLDIGSRINVSGLNTNSSGKLEPRVSLTYNPIGDLIIKGSAGIYLQEMTTISDEDEIISVFDPWIIIPDYLNPATGYSLSGGIQYNLSSNSNIQIEAYHRNSNNTPVLNDEKYFNFDPDLVEGSQESYGWEFTYDLTETSFSLSASYSLSWAYKKIDSYIYYPKYDSRHSGNLMFSCNPGAGWNLTSIWSVYSGLPFTEIISYYDKYNLVNPFEITPGASDYVPYLILADKNLGRLPSYHRLDIGLSKKIAIASTIITLSIDAINVYNRKNIFYYERDTGRRVNMLPFLLTGTVKIEI